MFNFLFPKKTLKEFVKSCEHRYAHTPDEYRLDRKRYHWLLEYGELMNGLPMHKLIGITPVTPAFTDERFTLLIRKSTSIPVAVKCNIQFPKAKIAGELYPLTKQEIINLDKYRENGVSFKRKLVRIRIPDGSCIHAWIYVGGNKLIEEIKWDIDFYRGRPSSRFSVGGTVTDNRPWLGYYYHLNASDFSRRDDKCYLYFHRNLDAPKDSRAA